MVPLAAGIVKWAVVNSAFNAAVLIMSGHIAGVTSRDFIRASIVLYRE
jgi:hypothetical protein